MSLTLGKTHITEARLYYSFITKAATGFYQERQRRGPLPKLDPDPVREKGGRCCQAGTTT